MIIAIDGSAASGKGTLAKALAKHLNFDYLDTGALYRVVALSLINSGSNLDRINVNQALDCVTYFDFELVKSQEIRSELVGVVASKVASLPSIRDKLLSLQRTFAESPPSGLGAVIDGRDIGTVVFPNADLKFFIDANIEVRASRRTNELLNLGQSVMFSRILSDMQARDCRDKTREVAPLRPADDAIIIDTSDMDAAAVFSLALSFISLVY